MAGCPPVFLLWVAALSSTALGGPVTFTDGVYDGFVVGIDHSVPAVNCKTILANLEVSSRFFYEPHFKCPERKSPIHVDFFRGTRLEPCSTEFSLSFGNKLVKVSSSSGINFKAVLGSETGDFTVDSV